MKLPGFKQRIEPDVVGDPDTARNESWAAVRDPRLGAWRITLIRRAVWAVIAAALPVSLLAVMLAVWSVSRSGAAQDDVADLWQRPPPVWAPAHDAAAEVAAARFASLLGMRVAADLDTAQQAASVGFAADGFVGGANGSTGGPDARLDWASVPSFLGGERHSFLLAAPDGTRFESLSFMISADGTVGWPHLVPEVPGDDAHLGVAFDGGYDVAATLFGMVNAADDEDSGTAPSLPSLCVGEDSQHSVAAPAGLSEQVENYLRAYTAGDSDTLREVARSGTETAVYHRTGYRYRPLSLHLVCYLQPDGEQGLPGTVQVWWLAEKTDGTGVAVPEMRDLRAEATNGLWRVFDPVPPFAHPPLRF